MCHQKKYITNEKKSKHLTYEDRQKIEYDLKNGTKRARIAEKLEKHISTINREIRLGMCEYVDFNDPKLSNGIGKRYSAEVAQAKRDYANSAKGGRLKIDNFPEEAKKLEKLIKSGFSPYAAIQKLELDLCVKTVYMLYNDADFEHFRKRMLKITSL